MEKFVKKTQQEVEEKLKEKGPNLKMGIYTGANDKVEFECSDCGYKGSTTYRSVLNSACGCPKCGVQQQKELHAKEHGKQRIEKERPDLILTNVEKHDKGGYITVQCPVCGNLRTAYCSNILKYKNCPSCGHIQGGNKMQYSTKGFIEEAQKIHGNRYDYSKVEYKGNKAPVCIICPEHGEFGQVPTKHIYARHNCPRCSMSHMEEIVFITLQKNNISFIPEYPIFYKDKKMRADFYFIKNGQQYIIETNGEQHYRETTGTGRSLQEQQERDKLLQEYCDNNNIRLLGIKFDELVENKVLELLNVTTTCRSIK